MSLSRTSLTIGQNCAIESLQDWVNNGHNSCIVNILLLTWWIKNGIKVVINEFWITCFLIYSIDATSLFIFKGYTQRILGCVQFSLIQWSKSTEYSHVSSNTWRCLQSRRKRRRNCFSNDSFSGWKGFTFFRGNRCNEWLDLRIQHTSSFFFWCGTSSSWV